MLSLMDILYNIFFFHLGLFGFPMIFRKWSIPQEVTNIAINNVLILYTELYKTLLLLKFNLRMNLCLNQCYRYRCEMHFE